MFVKMNSKIRFLFLICFMFYFVNFVSGAVLNINNCTNLSVSGTYYNLTNDITNFAGSCFISETSNVVVDCNGFTVDGIGGGHAFWFLTNHDNITIQNCKLTDWDNAISMMRSDYSSVYNVSIEDSTTGFFTYDVNSLDIENLSINNMIQSCLYFRWNTRNSNIKYLNVTNCKYGIYFNDRSTRNNVFENIYVKNNSLGAFRFYDGVINNSFSGIPGWNVVLGNIQFMNDTDGFPQNNSFDGLLLSNSSSIMGNYNFTNYNNDLAENDWEDWISDPYCYSSYNYCVETLQGAALAQSLSSNSGKYSSTGFGFADDFSFISICLSLIFGFFIFV